jgi:hypothetical protein
MAALFMMGCGHHASSGTTITANDGGGTPADGADVTGTIVDLSITESGETPVAVGPDRVSLAALLPQTGGGFSTIAGIVNADGSFRIPAVPEGPYYLSVKRADDTTAAFVVTSERELDLGRVYGGRPDTRRAEAPSSLVVTADGLAPWQDTDQLEVFSLGAGSFSHLEYQTPPPTGATSLSAYAVDVSLFDGPMLLEGSKGDRAIFTQLVTRTAGDISYQSVGRAFTAPQFSQTNGQSASVSGSFTEVPESRISLAWKRSAFSALAHDVNPAATADESDIGLWVEPGGTDRVTYSFSPDLLYLFDTATTDVTVDLDYGNPYPTSWGVIGAAFGFYSVALGPNTTANAFIGTSAPLASLTQPLQPTLSPPRNITVGGASAYGTLTGVGLSPAVAWEPPAIGAPSFYTVTVWQIDAMGLSNWKGTLTTTETSAILPPGLLENGAQHYLTVRAETNAGFSVKVPFKFHNTDAYAEGLTMSFTP